jgi:hypothetical protein
MIQQPVIVTDDRIDGRLRRHSVKWQVCSQDSMLTHLFECNDNGSDSRDD